METAILAANVLSQLQAITQPSAPDDNLDTESGENDFPVYFNEAINKEIGGGSGSPVKDNLTCEVCNTETYSDDAASKDLSIQLQAVVNGSNIMEASDTVITEMSASIFLSMMGFGSEDIKAALQSMGGTNSSPDIKAVDFLENLGFSEETAKEMAAQVIVRGNSAFDSVHAEKINSENSIMPVLKFSKNYNEMLSNIKRIASDEPQQKTAPNIENAFSEPILDTLKKGDMVNPLRIGQTDSGALYTLKEIKNIISGKLENSSLLDLSEADGVSLDLPPQAKIPAGEVKIVKSSDKSGNIAALAPAVSQGEGNEQNIDFDLSGGDNFSLNAKEYAVLKQGDSTGKSGVENIAQSQKTIIDKAVISQIVEKAAIFIRGEKNEIKIHLDPPSLGSVHIKVSMESNNMKATMVADTPLVKEVIESNLGDLKRSLSDSGIKVDQFSVLVGNGYDYKNGKHDLMHNAEQSDASEPNAVNLTDKKIEAIGNIDSRNIINIFI